MFPYSKPRAAAGSLGAERDDTEAVHAEEGDSEIDLRLEEGRGGVSELMASLDARFVEQTDRRTELGQYVARLKSDQDEEVCVCVCEFVYDFDVLVCCVAQLSGPNFLASVCRRNSRFVASRNELFSLCRTSRA